MTTYTVVVPSEVKRQITEIVLFIADDSVDNALAWEGRLTAALDTLAEVHGHAVDEAASGPAATQGDVREDAPDPLPGG